MAIVTLVTGSNLGNRYENLSRAETYIKSKVGDVLTTSSYCESEPWGFNSDKAFLNQALIVNTRLNPYELLEVLQEIEKKLGRETKSVDGAYTDRTLDIDIIFFSNLVINDYPKLVIPHPLMHKRRFVLEPINEIASTLIHPTRKLSIRALLAACTDGKKLLELK